MAGTQLPMAYVLIVQLSNHVGLGNTGRAVVLSQVERVLHALVRQVNT